MVYQVNREKDFIFSRKLFIKDLFSAKDIFAQFNEITFLSFQAFLNFIGRNLFTTGSQFYNIPITSQQDLDTLMQILAGTKLDENVWLTLHIDQTMIKAIAETITDQRIRISGTRETIEALSALPLSPTVEYWTEYHFTADNYAEEYEKLVKFWLADPRFSLIDLTFDYVSFETKPFSELHKLYFYMNLIRSWMQNGGIEGAVPGSPQNITNKTLILKNRQRAVSCYVDENLDIRLNPSTVYFSMSKYLELDGETIETTALNAIRKIVDYNDPSSRIMNQYLVDLDQNQQIMGDHYRVPYITDLICTWLGLIREMPLDKGEASTCQ